MAKVVAVHGIFHQYDSRASVLADWMPHLLGGVENATGRSDLLTARDLNACFYGGVYRAPGQRLSNGIPAYTADDLTEPDEHELLLRWWRAAATLDPHVVSPDVATLSTRSVIHRAVRALLHFKPFAAKAEKELVFFLKQVTGYFDPDTRSAIQAIFASSITEDTRVVVAHSLGSVVAYEGLCAIPDSSVGTLVTLGSPLGVPNVIFHRLLPPPSNGRGVWPPRLRRWVNVSDATDIVALVKKLGSVFDERIEDFLVDNGLSAHSAHHYLTDPLTGRAIAAGLEE